MPDFLKNPELLPCKHLLNRFQSVCRQQSQVLAKHAAAIEEERKILYDELLRRLAAYGDIS